MVVSRGRGMGAGGESESVGGDDLIDASDVPLFPNSLPIKKLSVANVPPKDFERDFIDRAVPAVLTDVVATWPCAQKWTLDWFAENHGETQVSVDDGTTEKMRCSLKAFVELCHDDNDARQTTQTSVASTSHETTPGDALTPVVTTPGDESTPVNTKNQRVVPYLRTWNFLDDLPELEKDIEQNGPYFRDYFQALKQSWRPPFTWLFLGGKGVSTKLHVDVWHTDAWLCSLQGVKKFVLFHPGHLKYIFHEGTEQFVDLQNVDHALFPDFHKAVPIETTLNKGETIYLPRKWPHYAVSTTPGVSLTTNFLSSANRRNVVQKTVDFANRKDACETLLGRTLRASDNVLKFCVHGGRVRLSDAAKVMGVTCTTLQDKMNKAKRDRLMAEQTAAEGEEEEGGER